MRPKNKAWYFRAKTFGSQSFWLKKDGAPASQDNVPPYKPPDVTSLIREAKRRRNAFETLSEHTANIQAVECHSAGSDSPAKTITFLANEWSGDSIREIRNERGQSQTDFGLELLACTKSYAQKRVSQLENGKKAPTAAERRTLQRMMNGEV